MQRLKNFLFKNTTSKQTIAKNTFWLFAGEGLGRLLRFILIIFAARVLTAEGLGIFSYALSIASLFTFFSDWGLNTLMIKSLSQSPDTKHNHEASAILCLKFGLTFIMSAIALLIGPHISSIEHARPIILITISISFFDTLRDFAIGINRSSEKMEREAVIRIATNLLICICGVIGLLIAPSVATMALAYLIGSSIGFIISLSFIRKTIILLVPLFSWKQVTGIFSIAWPFAILNLMSIALSNIDIISLGRWDTVTNVGIYSAAQRAAQFFYIIPTLFSFALFPRFSREAVSNTPVFQSLIERSVIILCAITFPIIIGGAAIATPILTLLFGASFSIGNTSFIILIACLPLVFLQTILSSTLVAQGKQQMLMIASAVGVGTGIILSTILVPRYGMTGAALAVFGTHLITTILLWKNNSEHLSLYRLIRRIQKISYAAFTMGVVAFVTQLVMGYLIVTIIFAIISYLGMLYLQDEPVLQEILSLRKD